MRRLGFVLFVLVVAGCMPRVPRQRLAAPAPLALGIVVDPDRSGELFSVPETLRDGLTAELREHNFDPQDVPLTAFGARRLSEARLAALKDVTQTPWLALVELRARFFSQMEGRYRWEVSAKVTVTRREGAGASDTFVLPVMLSFEHEKEADALSAASADLATRLGALIDGLLQGASGAAPQRTGPRAIYFVMVDRFANGDRANDGDANPADPQAFHGGDLAGVLDRLDWLQDLGIDTVWLSPVFSMRTAPWHGYGAFHGYWTWRMDRLEPRFGDEALLGKLSDELHRRGMKLVLDLVLNHVGPDAPLLTEHPEWFHHLGGVTDWSNPEQLLTHDVHGLTDFAQENPGAADYLLGSARRWLRARPA